MPMLPLTRSKHLMPFAAVLLQHNTPVRRVLRKAYLPENCLDDPEILIPVAREERFRELVAQKTGLTNISLVATRDIEVEHLGQFGLVLLKTPTVHRALLETQRLVPTQTSNLTIDLRPRPGGDIFCGLRFQFESAKGDWHNALYVISLLLKIVRLADPSWSPSEISIRLRGARTRFEAIEALGSTARFEQHDTGFLVPASMLARPVAQRPVQSSGQSIQGDDLWSTAPSTTYADALQQLIRSYASEGWLNIQQASDVTSTSVRTLQRRLSAEQTTYSSVIETTRAQMAGELLEGTDTKIAEIADHLGYNYQGDFTRAFSRWAGISPSAFRRQRKAA